MSSEPESTTPLATTATNVEGPRPEVQTSERSTRRTVATVCIVFVLLIIFVFGSTSVPGRSIAAASRAQQPLDESLFTLPPQFTGLPDADAPKAPSSSSSSSPNSNSDDIVAVSKGGAIFDSSTLDPAFRCPVLLRHGPLALQRDAANFTRNEPALDNMAGCPPTQRHDVCAQRWLQKCWWSSARRHGGELCANISMFRDFVLFLRPPRKSFHWKENAPNFLMELKSFLASNTAIMATPCAVVREISKRGCAVVSRRDLSFEFVRRDDVDVKQQQQSPMPIQKVRLTGHFSTDVSVKVLESFEFQDMFNQTKKKKQQMMMNSANSSSTATRIDLFTVGMFFRNLDYAKSSWATAERVYFSKFQFRHRHFFSWNSVRPPSVRLAKARDLYGAELKKRNDFIRREVLNGDYQTWLTLDVNFPGMADLTSLFQHVVVLRTIGFMYLTSLDEDAAKNAPFAARLVDKSLASISSSGLRSAESRKIADYVVLVRPDNFFNLRNLATISRSTPDGDLIIVSGRRGKSFRLGGPKSPTTDAATRLVLCGGVTTGSSRGKHSSKVDRVTDQFMVSGTLTLAHVYISIINVLHSCIQWPMPRYPFIEFFMVQGVREAGARADYVQFGSGLDRFGGETTTVAPQSN